VAAATAAAGAFLLAVPYAVIDLPAFLTGFAAQGARFSRVADGDPAGVLYLKHFALMGRLWLPAAALGIAILLVRGSLRSRAWPVLAFAGAYFYTLASHGGVVFARYALPLLPVLCVFAALPVEQAWRVLERLGRRRTAQWVLTVGALALTVSFAVQSLAWGRQFAAPDTRQIAAQWMKANLPRGARLAVEYGGPTYLGTLGFEVFGEGLEHGPDWYRDQGVAYIVISDPDRSREYLRAGPLVFAVAPAPTRWGPPIRIVRVEGAVQR
jgi:hypothetical protein